MAVGESSVEIVKFLISHRADVNVQTIWKTTPLHCAASRGCVEIAKILVTQGADLNTKDINGDIPLDVAKKEGNTNMVEYLLGQLTVKGHICYTTRS